MEEIGKNWERLGEREMGREGEREIEIETMGKSKGLGNSMRTMRNAQVSISAYGENYA